MFRSVFFFDISLGNNYVETRLRRLLGFQEGGVSKGLMGSAAPRRESLFFLFTEKEKEKNE